ncbi:MAG: hypothetical protein V4631_21165 [Pseudomonadota bacterium]
MAEPRAKTDWEPIERAYRSGQFSNRQLAQQYSVSEGMIRKKIKAEGWEKDLTSKVQSKVRADLVRNEVRIYDAQAEMRTEREIVETAAATVVQVVREHRKSISKGREMVSLLMHQLCVASQTRDQLEDIIDEETKNDETAQRRVQLMRAVSLPAQAGVLRDLATAMKSLIPLERVAFNITDEPPKNPLDALPDEQVKQRANELAARLGMPKVG